VADCGFVSEAASVEVSKDEGCLDGDPAAEAEVRNPSPGDAGVDDGAAALAGGSEAVGEAEAKAEAEAEAVVEAV